MALTLLEANKYDDGNLKRAAIIEMFATASEIVRAMPFIDIPGDSYSYNLEAKLPGVTFRGYNEAYVSSEGIINPEVERLRIVGNDLDVDKALIKTRGEGIRSTQEAMQVKSLSLNFADRIINGDSVTNPKEFDGLRARIGGQQLISANSATPNVNAPLSLEALDKAIDQVDGATHLIVNRAMKRRLSAAARANVGGDIFVDSDKFGYRVMFYNDMPILTADYNADGARIIDFNEAGPAGGVNSTSIYVVNMSEGYLSGLQNGGIDIADLGEIDVKPVFRTRFEWLVGMALMNGRSAARVWGIQDAAVTI